MKTYIQPRTEVLNLQCNQLLIGSNNIGLRDGGWMSPDNAI